MRPLRRRDVLGLLAGTSIASWLGPKAAASFVYQPQPLPPLIDAHCHLFNITDLPAAKFTQKVLLGLDDPASAFALRGIEAALSVGVPTAARELVAGPALARKQAQEGKQPSPKPSPFIVAPIAASRCETSGGPDLNWNSAVSWMKTLRSSRAAMAQNLAAEVTRSGFAPRLLCPALVDYSNWLEQTLRSPLPDQVRVHGMLARTASLPPVHGYMAFDPLRRAIVRRRAVPIDGNWDPLRLTREALVDHGFLGIKVYPPMGFRAGGNEAVQERYPRRAERIFGSAANLSRELDRSLDELWALCTELDAPVMAHAANSNEAAKGYGQRADPTFWLPVLRSHPGLRVLLGHFGGFGSYSAEHPPGGTCPARVPFDATWEAVIGRAVTADPNINLFADISYFSELFDTREQAHLRRQMQRYLTLDPGGRHLVYGSDWIMIGIEQQYPRPPGYARRVADFLLSCGLTEQQVSDVMYGNAVRFLGLQPGTRARQRILDFYARHGLPASRLPA